MHVFNSVGLVILGLNPPEADNFRLSDRTMKTLKDLTCQQSEIRKNSGCISPFWQACDNTSIEILSV